VRDDFSGAHGSAVVEQPLATRLRNLAADEVYGPRSPRLLEIAAAVEGDPSALLWAELDLNIALDVQGPLGADSSSPVVTRRLEIVRTVLIFCPLLVTWVGLFLAGRAYNALTNSDPEAARLPFLKLWLSGFHGRTPVSLQRMALVTVLLIGALIVVSILLDRRGDADVESGLREQQAKRAALRDASTDAMLALAKHRLASPERFREEITRSSAAFGQVVGQIRAITDVVTGSLRELGVVAERLEAATSSSAETVREVEDTADRMSGVLARVEESLSGTLHQVRQSIDASGELLAHQVASSNAEVDRAVKAFSKEAAVGLQKLEGVVVANGAELAMHVQTSGQIMDRALREGTGDLGHQITTAVGALGDGVRDSLTKIQAAVLTNADDVSRHVQRASQEVDRSAKESAVDLAAQVAAAVAELGAGVTGNLEKVESAVQSFNQHTVAGLDKIEGAVLANTGQLAEHVKTSSGIMERALREGTGDLGTQISTAVSTLGAGITETLEKVQVAALAQRAEVSARLQQAADAVDRSARDSAEVGAQVDDAVASLRAGLAEQLRGVETALRISGEQVSEERRVSQVALVASVEAAAGRVTGDVDRTTSNVLEATAEMVRHSDQALSALEAYAPQIEAAVEQIHAVVRRLDGRAADTTTVNVPEQTAPGAKALGYDFFSRADRLSQP
jgi:hypothetical protein